MWNIHPAGFRICVRQQKKKKLEQPVTHDEWNWARNKKKKQNPRYFGLATTRKKGQKTERAKGREKKKYISVIPVHFIMTQLIFFFIVSSA